MGTGFPRERTAGPLPSVPVPLPEALWKIPARSPKEEAAYRKDARLDRPLPASSQVAGQPVWRVLGVAADTAELDLIAATALNERRLPKNAKLQTVRDLLNAVEERTGGGWRSVGGIYALQQDLRIERMARTDSWHRKRRVPDEFTSFQQGLSTRSRALLARQRSLSASQLSAPECAALASAVLTAYGIQPDVARQALDLRGVSLKLRAPEPEQKLERRVEYQLPRIPIEGEPGEPIFVAWVNPKKAESGPPSGGW